MADYTSHQGLRDDSSLSKLARDGANKHGRNRQREKSQQCEFRGHVEEACQKAYD